MAAGVTGRLGQFEILNRRFDGEEVAKFAIAATCLGCLTLFVTRRTGYRAIALPAAALPFAFWAARIIQRSAVEPQPVEEPPAEGRQPREETPGAAAAATERPTPATEPPATAPPNPEVVRLQEGLATALAGEQPAEAVIALLRGVPGATFIELLGQEESRLGEAVTITANTTWFFLSLLRRCQTNEQRDQVINLVTPKGENMIHSWLGEVRSRLVIHTLRAIQQWPDDADKEIAYNQIQLNCTHSGLPAPQERIDDVIQQLEGHELQRSVIGSVQDIAEFTRLVNEGVVPFAPPRYANHRTTITDVDFQIRWDYLVENLRNHRRLDWAWSAFPEGSDIREGLAQLSQTELIALYRTTPAHREEIARHREAILAAILRPAQETSEVEGEIIIPEEIARHQACPAAQIHQSYSLVSRLQRGESVALLPISLPLLRLLSADIQRMPVCWESRNNDAIRAHILYGTPLPKSRDIEDELTQVNFPKEFTPLAERVKRADFTKSFLGTGSQSIPAKLIELYNQPLSTEWNTLPERVRNCLIHVFQQGALPRDMSAKEIDDLLQSNEEKWHLSGLSMLCAERIATTYRRVPSLLNAITCGLERPHWTPLLHLFCTNLEAIARSPEYGAWFEEHGVRLQRALAQVDPTIFLGWIAPQGGGAASSSSA